MFKRLLFLQSNTRQDIRYQIVKFNPENQNMVLRNNTNGVEFGMPHMTAEEIKRLDYSIDTVESLVPEEA